MGSILLFCLGLFRGISEMVQMKTALMVKILGLSELLGLTIPLPQNLYSLAEAGTQGNL